MRTLAFVFLLAAPSVAAQSVTFAGLQDGVTYDAVMDMHVVQSMHLSVAGQTQDIPMTNVQRLYQTLRPVRTAEGWTVTSTMDRSVSRSESPMMEAPLEIDTDRPDEIAEDQRAAMMANIGKSMVAYFTPAFKPIRMDMPEGVDVQLELGRAQAGMLGTHTVGAVWADTTTMTMSGIANQVISLYTLREVRGDSARFTYTQTLSGEGAIRAPGVPETIETLLTLSGTGEGTAWVHRANGGSLSDGTMTMQGLMTMQGEGLEAPMNVGISTEVRMVHTVRAKL